MNAWFDPRRLVLMCVCDCILCYLCAATLTEPVGRCFRANNRPAC